MLLVVQKAVIAVLALGTIAGAGVSASAAVQHNASVANEGVCAALDSGKIDTTGDPMAVSVTAPAGKVIDGYCVKAGSVNTNDEGPKYYDLVPGVTSLTISYIFNSKRAVSHYSLSYAVVPTLTPSATPTAAPTAAPSPSATPAGTPTGTPTSSPSPTATPSDSPSPTPTKTHEDDTPKSTPTPSSTPTSSATAKPEKDPEPQPSPSQSTGTGGAGAGGGDGFDWNWTYPAPTCSALTIGYPSDLPADQANDVNVRFSTSQGSFTLNYHLNGASWSGTKSFVFTNHPDWPAGLGSYSVVWAQVGGTNYHWSGSVNC